MFSSESQVAPNKENPIKIHESWKPVLLPELQSDYMLELRAFLRSELHKKKSIFPKGDEYFNAFNSTPFDQVKVVIIGQDPYHGPGQAHGLCFSVPPGVKIPPSLKNIYKELQADVGVEIPNHGNLSAWAQQGVLLLNATLTVEAGQAGSHQNRGWEQFTDRVIELLNEQKDSLVFVLWGAYAQNKGKIIDRSRHHVIQSVHPSPLSAHRGFFGSKPFSQINKFLLESNQEPIDWSL